MEFYKQDAMSSVIPSFSTSRISESRSFSSSLHGANALLRRGTAAAAAAAAAAAHRHQMTTTTTTTTIMIIMLIVVTMAVSECVYSYVNKVFRRRRTVGPSVVNRNMYVFDRCR